MDLVLGMSLTSEAVRWVLVEGSTGEGDPIDRGELVVPAAADFDADLLVHAVLNPDVVAHRRIRVVGVTATRDARVAAADVANALAARVHGAVVSVSDAAAVAALADGIAGLTEHDAVAVCIVEPDSAFVALVSGGEVTVEHVDRPADRADALELTSAVISVLDGRHVDAIFVIGSDDVDLVASSFEAIVEAPVFSAAEADLALARGAALASARTLDMSDPTMAAPPRRHPSRVGVLTTVLAAAATTFVVSSSIALGLTMTRNPPAPQRENVHPASEPVTAAVQGAPAPLVRFADSPLVLARTMLVKAPPPPPVYVPPPVAAPAPPPVYRVPAPVYVPPPPKPRLRDRIIERIPIIGRFHEPGG